MLSHEPCLERAVDLQLLREASGFLRIEGLVQRGGRIGVFVRFSLMSTHRLPVSGSKNMNTFGTPLVLVVFSSGPPRRYRQCCPGLPEHLLGRLVHAHLRTTGVVGARVDLEQ